MRSFGVSCLVTIFWCCVVALPASNAADHSPFDLLSKQLAKQITDIKIRKVVVADFTNLDGTQRPEGPYFADLFSAYFAQPGRELKVVNREQLTHTLVIRNITLSLQSPAETLQEVGKNMDFEAIAFGTVEKTEKQLLVSVFVKRVLDGQTIASSNTSVARSDFYESLASYPRSKTPTEEIRHANEQGVSAPECLDCPVPQFRSRADASSQALLAIVVSAEGRVVAIKVVRGAGPEFADEAMQRLRVFRYKPAHDKKGRPVPVFTFVAVSFRVE
jgi:hypothetical protein